MTTARPEAAPGYCFRSEQDVPDAILVAVIERGSGPPAGNMACLAHAHELVRTAVQFVDPEASPAPVSRRRAVRPAAARCAGDPTA